MFRSMPLLSRIITHISNIPSASAVMIVLMVLCTVVFSTSQGDIQLQEHLQPLGSYPPLQRVAILDSIPTPEYFYKWYVKSGQPVLFRSALTNPDFKYPAYQLWTDDYLRAKYSKYDITFEYHKKETRNPDDRHETDFGDFLDNYATADIYMVMDLYSMPGMLEEVYLPPFLRCGGYQKLLTLYNMWFSGGGTKSVLHKDSMDNINCLLDGTKEIVFFDKRYGVDIETDGFDDSKGYSTVDVDQVDLDKFPKFKSLPWIKAQMKKGDCLFIPQYWYHQVNSYGSRNLAVNQWFEHPLWFNTSDCDHTDQLGADLPLSQYPADFSDETLRVNIFESFDGYPHLHESDLKTLLSDKSKSQKVFDYLNTNQDDHVSWEEVHHMDFRAFLHKFKDVLHEDLKQGLETMQAYIQQATRQQPDKEQQEEHREKTEL